MFSHKFKVNKVDKYIYVKKKHTDKGYVIVYLYVKDILILGSNDHMIKSTKKILTNKFDMKDLSVADVILGINIFRTCNGYVLSQSYYVEKVFDKFFKGENSIIQTSMDKSIYLSKNKSKGIDQLKYYRIIKSLMYVINCIRPDISYLIRKLSRFLSNPTMDH